MAKAKKDRTSRRKAAKPVFPDPIYEAISNHRHKAASFLCALDVYAVYEAQKLPKSSPGVAAADRAVSYSGKGEVQSANALAATVPLTTRGLYTVLKYVDTEISRGNLMLDQDGMYRLIKSAVECLKTVEASQ